MNPQIPTIHPEVDLLSKYAERFQHRVDNENRSTEKNAGLQDAAKEFESLFLAYLLKVMRETIEDSGLTDSGLGKNIYTELFDQELAKILAQRGTLGISGLLIDNLSQGSDTKGKATNSPPGNDSTPTGSPSTGEYPGEHLGGNLDVPDFRLPVRAPLSSEFGLRKDPFTDRVRFHKGIDLAAPEGTSVRAALGGEVIFSGNDRTYGNTVVLQHPGGFQTRYAHLGAVSVSRGDRLDVLDLLGEVGSSGRSTGPHLHFEISRLGQRIDPLGKLVD